MKLSEVCEHLAELLDDHAEGLVSFADGTDIPSKYLSVLVALGDSLLRVAMWPEEHVSRFSELRKKADLVQP